MSISQTHVEKTTPRPRLPLLGLCFLGFLLHRLLVLTRLRACLFLCLSSVAGLV